MARVDKIKTGLFGRVGFRNSIESGYDIVSEANQASASGLYFQDASPLVTIKNIKDCQNIASISSDDFNNYLTTLQESVIMETYNKVFNSESCFVYSNNLFPFEKTFSDTIDKKSRFVGMKIEPTLRNDMVLKIPSVELSFDSEVTFNLYLYNSNLPKSPIQTKEVTTTAGESVIVDLDWYIADDAGYKGGTFYLGYFDDDIGTAKAYNKNYENASIMFQTPYYYVELVSVENSGTTINVDEYTSESDSFGLNIFTEVSKDYSQIAIRNKSMFDQAIQLQMHERVLLMMLTSTRSNSTERLTKEIITQIRVELYGNTELNIAGVQGKLSSMIDSIKKTLFYTPVICRKTLR